MRRRERMRIRSHRSWHKDQIRGAGVEYCMIVEEKNGTKMWTERHDLRDKKSENNLVASTVLKA